MVTEVTPAPISIRATPFSFSESVRTACAVALGVNSLRAGAMPISLSIMSMLLTGLLAPMKILKFPSRTLAGTPTMSFSLAPVISSSAEKDWATAP